MMLAGDPQAASTNAQQAANAFSQLGQQESEWRALTVAAQSAAKGGDKIKAHEYALKAKDRLSGLEQRWNAESYRTYLNRPDIERLKKELDLLANVAA